MPRGARTPAAALVLALVAGPSLATAQADDRLVPGLGLVEAQILARPADGQFIVRGRATLPRAALEAGIAGLCAAPAEPRAIPLFTDRDRKPGDVTYLVRCRP